MWKTLQVMAYHWKCQWLMCLVSLCTYSVTASRMFCVASAMVIPLCLNSCLGNLLPWRCWLLEVEKYWGGFVGKPPCGIAVTAEGLAGPWDWQKEVERTRTWWISIALLWWMSIALPALPSTWHLQSSVRHLPQLPTMCTSQVMLPHYSADLSNN